MFVLLFFFSSRRRHTRWTGDWSSDVCSSDLVRSRIQYHGDAASYVYARSEPSMMRELFERRERSGERRVGEEGRSRGGAGYLKKKKEKKDEEGEQHIGGKGKSGRSSHATEIG